MARCKHNKKVSILEHGTAFCHHDLDCGKWDHHSEVGSLTGVIEVQCFECGYKKRFTNRRYWPQWLLTHIEEFINTGL